MLSSIPIESKFYSNKLCYNQNMKGKIIKIREIRFAQKAFIFNKDGKLATHTA